jgi:uncharacterized peroxidase-related enzyme
MTIVFKKLQSSKTIRDLFVDNPKKLKSILFIAQEILREDSALSSVDKEILAMATSNFNNCKYCTNSHKEFAISLGANKIELDEILENKYTGKLLPLIEYVNVLTNNINGSNEEYFKCKSAQFSDEEIRDAALVASLFNMYNRIVESHGLEDHPETYKEASIRINKFGYDGRYIEMNRVQ